MYKNGESKVVSNIQTFNRVGYFIDAITVAVALAGMSRGCFGGGELLLLLIYPVWMAIEYGIRQDQRRKRINRMERTRDSENELFRESLEHRKSA